MNYSKQIIRTKVVNAPESIQNLFFSIEKTEKIQEVGKKLGLQERQIVRLEEITNIVLIGLEPLSKFRSLMVGEMGTTYDQAIKISSEINSQIFEPVIGDLKNFENKDLENKPANSQAETPEASKTSDASHLLPSHEMIREPHLHSQTLMPKDGGNKMPIKTAFSTFSTPPVSKPIVPVMPPKFSPASVPTPSPAFKPASVPTAPIPVPQPLAPKFSSIVDQKLSKLVRTERDQAQVKSEVEEKRKTAYGGEKNDPYREPIK